MAEERQTETRAFLQPGELYVGDAPALVKTVVGSCLAIMMRAPRLRLASIAHCLLPEAGVPSERLSREEALRYVDTTIDLMLRAFAKRGVTFEEMEIKLFGGADSLAEAGESGFYVGRRNIAAAEGALASRGLRAMASAVGGRRGRTLEFDTQTGEVLVRRLPAHVRGGEGVSR